VCTQSSASLSWECGYIGGQISLHNIPGGSISKSKTLFQNGTYEG
jgi:hypothetical protein